MWSLPNAHREELSALQIPTIGIDRAKHIFWLGLVPRQRSSGGKEKLRGITKQEDPYIRKLLIIGAAAVLRFARDRAPTVAWTSGLLVRRPALVVAVALANKMARIAWAIWSRGGVYRAGVSAA